MKEPPRELLAFLDGYDPATQSLALGLRKVVIEEMAPCHEYIFEMRSKVVLVYGATERVIEDGMCIISVFAKHVNLAFQRGAELQDHAGVLQGTGTWMRHISVRKRSDLDRPDLREYLQRARKHEGLTPPRKGDARDVVTRVKARAKRSIRRRTTL